MSNYPNHIKSLAKQKGKRLDWLASKVGVSPSMLTRIMSGKSSPNIKVALKIAHVLETTVEEIWEETKEDEKDG